MLDYNDSEAVSAALEAAVAELEEAINVTTDKRVTDAVAALDDISTKIQEHQLSVVTEIIDTTEAALSDIAAEAAEEVTSDTAPAAE